MLRRDVAGVPTIVVGDWTLLIALATARSDLHG